jgi:hypothetical protein
LPSRPPRTARYRHPGSGDEQIQRLSKLRERLTDRHTQPRVAALPLDAAIEIDVVCADVSPGETRC